MNVSVADDPERLEQHPLLRSVILHLLPGALIVTCYIIAAPQVVNLGFPPGLAQLTGHDRRTPLSRIVFAIRMTRLLHGRPNLLQPSR
jgi:hypothetical protein